MAEQLAAERLAELLGLSGDWEFVAFLAVGGVHVGILMTIALVAAAGFTWLERKVSGRIQDRCAPGSSGTHGRQSGP